ncbi:hypothetical protein AGOR_G00123020 [Albula goreensis]|uniref:KAP NTPase domain-containing protein n=1 Tax=Albula goreensis TaxID=1534307 RepID=A0A8T3DEH2_9TELE|nr:hypothetical protein AGOR_G00123020 [Albula goreensis]
MDKKGALLDDIYAYGLSRALIKIAPPATVGLYCQCQNRIETLFKKIKMYMNREADWREQKLKTNIPPQPFLSPLLLLFSMVFLRPVWNMEAEQKRKRVRWIFVRFSAWHFAGSDKLWAGLVIRLFKAINDDFGELFVSVYRATQHPFPKRIDTQSRASWRVRKVCCVPLWIIAAAAATVIVLSCILLYVSGFQARVNGTLTSLSSLESVAIATLGPPAVIFLRFILRIGKNLIYSQDSIIQNKMNKSAVSEQLGFMNKVRKEVSVLIDLIHFMEVFENRKIRVVEDDRQRAAIDHPDGADESNFKNTLWKVFSDSSFELHSLGDRAEVLLEQDGDPELFERFLKVDFRFTVEDTNRLMPWTVNLDHSIKKELARLRGSTSLRDKMKYKTFAPLPFRSLMRMSTEDICKEMQRLNFPEKYQQLLRLNRLDGSSLALGDDGEIKKALQMALGEWISFSTRFLGAKPRSSPLTSNKMITLHGGDIVPSLSER